MWSLTAQERFHLLQKNKHVLWVEITGEGIWHAHKKKGNPALLHWREVFDIQCPKYQRNLFLKSGLWFFFFFFLLKCTWWETVQHNSKQCPCLRTVSANPAPLLSAQKRCCSLPDRLCLRCLNSRVRTKSQQILGIRFQSWLNYCHYLFWPRPLTFSFKRWRKHLSYLSSDRLITLRDWSDTFQLF